MHIKAGQYSRWGLAAALIVGNLLMYLHFENQTIALQQTLAALDSRLSHMAETRNQFKKATSASAAPGTSLTDARLSLPPVGLNVSDPSVNPVMAAVDRIRQLKQRKSSADISTLVADLNNRMTGEPALPAIEQEQTSWLNDSVQRMPTDAPHASGLQTRCQGRRCLVSAAFASKEDAENWGARYLLAGGGRLLQHSSTVIVPLGGKDQSVALQLYLY